MRKVISISSVDMNAANSLSSILCNDQKLIKELGISRKVSPKTFLDDITSWQAKTNSKSFAIILDGEAIGLISLSHQSGDEARIGYWLASSYWNKGYTTQAFDKILARAKASRFRTLKSTLDPNNLASLAIWEKKGADFKESGESLEAVLKIA